MIERVDLALHRCSYAVCVLALMPIATVRTMQNFGPIHVAMWCFSAAWTALVGKLYRRSAARWAQGGSDD